MAIDGLQQRILRTIDARGDFGVFVSKKPKEKGERGLLRRSLLWHRGSDTKSLSRIHFPPDRVISTVPSWSWMAYVEKHEIGTGNGQAKPVVYIGGIDYLKPDFDGIDWEDLRSPWADEANGIPQTAVCGGNIALTAKVREYLYMPSNQDNDGLLVFDNPGGSAQRKTSCVVLGIQKGSMAVKEKRHYLLLVTPTAAVDRNGKKAYERVGAGYLPGSCIEPGGEMVEIH